MDSILGPGNLILQVLFLIMAIVWLFVPFAVLAIRRLLAQLVHKQDETNALLRALVQPASGQAVAGSEADRDRPTIGNILKQVRDR